MPRQIRILATLAFSVWLPAAAMAEDIRTAVVAGGCFWCVEADFDKVEGVRKTVSGYAGGDVADPTYREVVRGGTGHLEVVEITYDADVLSYERLVELFLRSIDPTDAGGQFCDRGESYTTAIFAATEAEREIARAELAEAEAALGQEVVTDLRGEATFYPAEDYHQDFYKTNPLRYKTYRAGCRRDSRVEALWGEDAILNQVS